MKYQNKQYRIIFVLAISILTSLACNQLSGPKPPEKIAKPSSEALASFNQKWSNLFRTTPTGPFSISFTGAEMTSAAAKIIEQAKTESGKSIPVEDVQVVLEDDVINIYGRADIDYIEASGLVVVVPAINADGHLQITTQSVEFGALEIDPTYLSEILNMVESTINEPIQNAPFTITLTAILIDNGQMTINGVITP